MQKFLTPVNSFLDAVTETLVVSGVSTVTANKVATALDDMTSSKGRAAIRRGWDGKNIKEVQERRHGMTWMSEML
jgi:hypothetical protein